jgi:acyl carrier protein
METAAPYDASASRLSAWMIARIAEYTEMEPASISPVARLTDLGLDSIYALALCGDLEDEMGLKVEPTVVWDHPTVEALARHLAPQLAP